MTYNQNNTNSVNNTTNAQTSSTDKPSEKKENHMSKTNDTTTNQSTSAVEPSDEKGARKAEPYKTGITKDDVYYYEREEDVPEYIKSANCLKPITGRVFNSSFVAYESLSTVSIEGKDWGGDNNDDDCCYNEQEELVYELDRGYAKLLGYFPDEYKIVSKGYIFSDGHRIAIVPLKNMALFCESHRDLVVYGDWHENYAYNCIYDQIESYLDEKDAISTEFLRQSKIQSSCPLQYNCNAPPNNYRISIETWPGKSDVIGQYFKKENFISGLLQELFWQSLLDHLALDCIETAKYLGSWFEGYFQWYERAFEKRREIGFLDDATCYLPSAIIALQQQTSFQKDAPIHKEIEEEKKQKRADNYQRELDRINEFGPY